VLAGYAYAGAVIAGAKDDRIKALVYVAALAPAEGGQLQMYFIAPGRIRRRRIFSRICTG